MQAWQTYTAFPKSPVIQQTSTCCSIIVSRVYDRMGAPTSTVIKHRVSERRKTSTVLFAEQQKGNIQLSVGDNSG